MFRRLTLSLALAAPILALAAVADRGHAAPIQPGAAFTAASPTSIETAQYRRYHRRYRRHYYRHYYRR